MRMIFGVTAPTVFPKQNSRIPAGRGPSAILLVKARRPRLLKIKRGRLRNKEIATAKAGAISGKGSFACKAASHAMEELGACNA
ncbi:hypothetical protein RA29_11680 [Tateyamaria sp. ANG-S1]|nr:hypothetical protein RA29_11680 [Tateyamaria sp. ANG-S1]